MNTQTWLPIVVVVALMLLRLRRASREQPLKLDRMWIAPLLVTVLIGLSLAQVPPPLLGWLALVVGLAVGAALGWHRGKLMRIRVDPATGQLFQQSSPAAIIILLGIVALRMGLKDLVGANPGDPHPALLAQLVTEALMGLAVGLLAFTRLEMYLRAKRLLEERGTPA
jgi:hypothetical protein